MVLRLVLTVAFTLGSAQVFPPEATRETLLVRAWLDAVVAHRPGTIDKPLLQVADLRPSDIDSVRQKLIPTIRKYEISARNDILRRGALLHTDIALLLPERAAEYLQSDNLQRLTFNACGSPKIQYRRDADQLVYSADGEYVSTAIETAHWQTARSLLRCILPHPSADEFVHRWYRAVAASFGDRYLLGNARYHLARSLEELPDDPILLFYSGATHDAHASNRIQSIMSTLPQGDAKRSLRAPTSADEWRLAEENFRAAVRAKAPVEASLRHARVLGCLGKHADAVAILRNIQPLLTTARLRYLGALFLGTEEGALGRIEQARAAFERAQALYPTAQSPLMGLAELYRRAGNRAEALAVVNRLQQLPSDAESREDPWTHYHRSFAGDADEQLAVVRGWVDREVTR